MPSKNPKRPDQKRSKSREWLRQKSPKWVKDLVDKRGEEENEASEELESPTRKRIRKASIGSPIFERSTSTMRVPTSTGSTTLLQETHNLVVEDSNYDFVDQEPQEDRSLPRSYLPERRPPMPRRRVTGSSMSSEGSESAQDSDQNEKNTAALASLGFQRTESSGSVSSISIGRPVVQYNRAAQSDMALRRDFTPKRTAPSPPPSPVLTHKQDHSVSPSPASRSRRASVRSSMTVFDLQSDLLSKEEIIAEHDEP